ncbi:NAD(P)-binding protein [Marasmius fiardii PR-910]|nr:NAD(P)-binding protein [Marasmius fiardii PR-910]
MVTTIRWGIISTGNIAECFAKDMVVDPKTRDVRDIVHKVTAVGSRSVDNAQSFIDRVLGGNKDVKGYGSYAEVYADSSVDAIYIGTPHTYHYENALDGIKAKKHILCEKPVTSNVAELRALIAAAKEHNVFFMEALWTRFHPLALEVKKISESGVLGNPIVVNADLSGDFDIHNIPTTHRILDPNLGGGAILDLGPYPLIWAIITLFEHPSNNFAIPSSITGSILKTPITGVDANTTFTLNFSEAGLKAQAVLSCSINANSIDGGGGNGVTIRYEKGIIRIAEPIFCPKNFTVTYTEKDSQGRNRVVKEEKRFFEYVGGGWHFQADEVARCIRDGKIESDVWTHQKSLLEMKIFDEVRRQGGYALPPGVEKVV